MPPRPDTDASAATSVDAVTDHQISVVPVEGGWSILSPLDNTPLMFLSGAKAEEKAKALALVIAAAGRDARVLIHDRTRALIGAWRYFAAEGPLAELPVRGDED